MVRKMLVLIMLSFLFGIGGFWALKAQDPKPQDPQTPQTPATTTTQPQTKETKATKATTQQVDLSGTYAGNFNCDAAGLTGATTLTINGNEFTTSDGKTGRIVASRTRGYTAVALQMSGATSPVISFRGKKSGNKLTLSPVAGSTQQCSFTTGAVAKGGGKQKTPAATGTEVSNPAATPSPSPVPTPSPTPEASPSPQPTPTPQPTPSPEASPSPSPEAMPSPTPNPSPEVMPSPTPSPSPEAMPSPTPRRSGRPRPTPSPSPTPTPA